MIAGTGIDIVEVDKIARCIDRHPRFLVRCFSEEERKIIGKARKTAVLTAAGRFAAKEAVLKALGTGLAGLRLKDVAIEREDTGRPKVVLKGQALAVAESKGITRMLVSISHTAHYAVAYALAEGVEPQNHGDGSFGSGTTSLGPRVLEPPQN